MASRQPLFLQLDEQVVLFGCPGQPCASLSLRGRAARDQLARRCAPDGMGVMLAVCTGTPRELQLERCHAAHHGAFESGVVKRPLLEYRLRGQECPVDMYETLEHGGLVRWLEDPAHAPDLGARRGLVVSPNEPVCRPVAARRRLRGGMSSLSSSPCSPSLLSGGW